MPSKKFERKGTCGDLLTGSVWKQGHTIKCERREVSALRYWKPSKENSRYSQHWPNNYDGIDAEIMDFCKYCSHKERSITLELTA